MKYPTVAEKNVFEDLAGLGFKRECYHHYLMGKPNLLLYVLLNLLNIFAVSCV